MKAIETRYAGHRFRSRLEARWAVFFDALGVEWQYEVQGYVTSQRLTLGDEKVPYLPDFTLDGAVAEVKGSLTVDECVRLLDIAASISSNDAGGCGDGPDVIVLGPIPRQPCYLPLALHMHKGDLLARPWRGGRSWCGDEAVVVATDYGGPAIFDSCTVGPGGDARAVADFLLGGWLTPLTPRAITRAYAAAREARFEHGETPAPRRRLIHG